jgi:hypothetical protein
MARVAGGGEGNLHCKSVISQGASRHRSGSTPSGRADAGRTSGRLERTSYSQGSDDGPAESGADPRLPKRLETSLMRQRLSPSSTPQLHAITSGKHHTFRLTLGAPSQMSPDVRPHSRDIGRTEIGSQETVSRVFVRPANWMLVHIAQSTQTTHSRPVPHSETAKTSLSGFRGFAV